MWEQLTWFLSTFIDGMQREPGLALDVIRETMDLVADERRG